VPKYITFNTDQAELARAASGAITYDITHPCIAYIPDWQAAGLIGAIDTTKFTAWKSVNKELAKPGIVDGKVYGIPWDWGFSAPMYRADKYTPSSQSWEAVLFDKKLRGKVTMYDEGVAIIKIGALLNGHQNVNSLTQKQIDQSKATMIKAKANIVSFWQSETQAMQDIISGKVYVTYAWPDTYAQVVAKPSMKNVKVVYMQPKEGQLAWICAFAIAAKPKNEALAYAYLNTAYSPPAMDFLVNAFFTGGSAMTPATLAKTDPKFVKEFHLNTLSTALKPPRVWLEQHLENRNAYLKAYLSVKSA
jgi:spermidine/putrescine-binding protein